MGIPDPGAALLPAAHDTLFLQACLQDAATARDAWRHWLDEATRDGTPARYALVPVNEFIPLLAWNLSQHGVDVEAGLRTHFRSAHLTEELRWKKYRDICHAAFALLRDAGVPFVALKGSVVGELVYPSPVFRHADDIDVLLHERDLVRADQLFTDAGWRRQASPALPNPKHLPPLVHAEGVPIELHRRLLLPHYTMPYDRLWARSPIVAIGGVQVHVLADSDALLYTVAHGASEGPGLRWLVDAWFILRTNPSLDWSVFSATVATARLDLLVSGGLRYLREFGAAVPAHVLTEIESRASRSGYVDRAAARPWPARRAFPSPVQFALHYDVPLWTVPFYYVYRLARFTRSSVPFFEQDA